MKFLGLCLLNYILMSCYIEIGHDKGWPKAAYMYSHFHKFVVPISSVLTHDDVAPQQSYLLSGTLFLLGENGAFPPTRNGCIHSLSMRERG